MVKNNPTLDEETLKTLFDNRLDLVSQTSLAVYALLGASNVLGAIFLYHQFPIVILETLFVFLVVIPSVILFAIGIKATRDTLQDYLKARDTLAFFLEEQAN